MQEKTEMPTKENKDAPENGASLPKVKKVKEVQASEPVAERTLYPSAVMLIKHYNLMLKMPNQTAHLNIHFEEGKKVYDPETIKRLIDFGAPVADISKERNI